MINKITRVPLRDVFMHEAYDFTKWLQNNLDVLNECTGLTLITAERESSAGAFSVDLLAEDESNNKVIIENQLERSDHDHLGKLITYLVAMEARAAIWIVSEPRPEHASAITWLNASSSADFYLLKLETITIGDSDPAPLLTQIVGPSEETKVIGVINRAFTERQHIRHQFWTRLLAYAKDKTSLHAAISPSAYNWIATGAGKTGLSFNYVIWEHEAGVELYIDLGKDCEEENKAIFDSFSSHKEEIEKVFGEPLAWERLDNRRASRIRKTIPSGGWKDPDHWKDVISQTVDAMIRLDMALRPFLRGEGMAPGNSL